jgi:hypothetical protein
VPLHLLCVRIEMRLRARRVPGPLLVAVVVAATLLRGAAAQGAAAAVHRRHQIHSRSTCSGSRIKMQCKHSFPCSSIVWCPPVRPPVACRVFSSVCPYLHCVVKHQKTHATTTTCPLLFQICIVTRLHLTTAFLPAACSITGCTTCASATTCATCTSPAFVLKAGACECAWGYGLAPGATAGPTTVCKPCGAGLGSAGGPSATTTCVPAGDTLYDTPGTFTWTAPPGVTKASAVCVGGGAGGAIGVRVGSANSGGGGGWVGGWVAGRVGLQEHLHTAEARAGTIFGAAHPLSHNCTHMLQDKRRDGLTLRPHPPPIPPLPCTTPQVAAWPGSWTWTSLLAPPTRGQWVPAAPAQQLVATPGLWALPPCWVRGVSQHLSVLLGWWERPWARSAGQGLREQVVCLGVLERPTATARAAGVVQRATLSRVLEVGATWHAATSAGDAASQHWSME